MASKPNPFAKKGAAMPAAPFAKKGAAAKAAPAKKAAPAAGKKAPPFVKGGKK